MLPCFERRYVFDLPPTQDASHHQDYSNSNKGSQTKPSLCHCYWEGATPNICIYIYVFSTVVDGCSCFFYTWRKNKFFEAPKTLPLKLTTSLPLKICKRAPKRK